LGLNWRPVSNGYVKLLYSLSVQDTPQPRQRLLALRNITHQMIV
jgi:hypothetical protein